MRTGVLLVSLLVVGGCRCGGSLGPPGLFSPFDLANPPLKDFCAKYHHGVCPDAATMEAEELGHARRQWLEGGHCLMGGGGTWANGTWLSGPVDFCGETAWFDKAGKMVMARAGCEAEVTHYGMAFDSSLTETPAFDLCARTRPGLAVAGVKLWGQWKTQVDGHELNLDDPGSPTMGSRLRLGAHPLTVDGRTATITIEEGPKHEVFIVVGDGELPLLGRHGRLAVGVKIPADNIDLEAELPDGGRAGFGGRPWLEEIDGGTR
ncbi:MAG: hypothetical protein QM723_09280 [Myxococcaceae bacterium]